MTTPAVGLDCKLYYNSGTNASPTWVEIENAINVSVPDYGTNQVAANSRASLYESFLPGLIRTGIDFQYLHVKGTDTVRAALLGMVSGRSAKQFAVMDAAIASAGSIGLTAYMNIENMSYTEDLEGVRTYDITLKPAYFVESSAKVEPAILTVSA